MPGRRDVLKKPTVLGGLLILALVLAGALIAVAGTPAAVIVIQGQVLDDGAPAAVPVAGAIVRWRGDTTYTVSAADGAFQMTAPADGHAHEITAWAPGYYVGSAIIAPGAIGETVTIPLYRHPTEDNADYAFISPVLDMEDPTACSHCHRDRSGAAVSTMPVEEWLSDAHANAAINPRFLSLYNGTSLDGTAGSPTVYAFDAALGVDVPVAPSQGQETVGPGFRLDYPELGGNCASCHVPLVALGQPYHADPNTATGVAAEAITCDFCHKIWDVRLQSDGLPDPSLPGVLSLEFLRPFEGEQVFIGPFDDTPGEDIYVPLQNQSEFCAACHAGEFWGTTAYNSFGEWLDSPYSDPETGQTCQDCHMPRTGTTLFAQLPPGDAHGAPPPRDPATIFSHRMLGAADAAFLATTVDLTVEAIQAEGQVRVTVRLTNSGAGHHVPTDNPLRNMILLVSAVDADGQRLPLVAGPTIPAWGGVGDPEAGYYAGLPGVLYAKVMADAFTGETPTYTYWRLSTIVSDNRLAALATDETVYTFALPADHVTHAGPVTVEAAVLLRRAFIDLMALKGWDTPDILMAEEMVVVP